MNLRTRELWWKNKNCNHKNWSGCTKKEPTVSGAQVEPPQKTVEVVEVVDEQDSNKNTITVNVNVGADEADGVRGATFDEVAEAGNENQVDVQVNVGADEAQYGEGVSGATIDERDDSEKGNVNVVNVGFGDEANPAVGVTDGGTAGGASIGDNARPDGTAVGVDVGKGSDVNVVNVHVTAPKEDAGGSIQGAEAGRGDGLDVIVVNARDTKGSTGVYTVGVGDSGGAAGGAEVGGGNPDVMVVNINPRGSMGGSRKARRQRKYL